MIEIKKTLIIEGVYWVEIPAAKLFILCGCPADSVKHLKKYGFIAPIESNGIFYESGPNVILFSDILLQNGDISNLAEFPVLQMLYRQGLIIPNHPNNTGAKPLLIGSREQVNAQSQYIYRGNYGLISKNELLEAGASGLQAEAMLNLKLKFAFGQIRKTEDFLDFRYIDREPVEVRNGVFVQRLQMNVFEFKFKNESVTVDLNLPEGKSYPSPYPITYHFINREYFSVVHFGEGDGWDIDRPSMSSLLMFQGKIYLIDAGPNTINNLMSLGISINEIEGIFHTHCHDDHFAGLTALIRADRRIKYYATSLVRASVAKKLSSLFSIKEELFSDYFEIHDLNYDDWNTIDGLEVKPILSPHPVETSIFFFRSLWHDGYRSYAHFADIVSLDVLKKMIREKEDLPGISQSFFDKVKTDYLSPADVKKLDIGGGMIHGVAEDFHLDKSKRIILSHTALALTDQQKAIGSGAPFGSVESLTPSYKNYVWQLAYKYLTTFFPTVPDHQVQVLLNNEVVKFNPQSIISKQGNLEEFMYLILTGNVETIKASKRKTFLYAGTLVGEMSGLYQIPEEATYRSVGFVQALRIPCALYFKFVTLNNLYTEIERLHGVREFLSNTWLFKEGLSYPIQNKIAKSARIFSLPTKKEIDTANSKSLYLIQKGKVERYLGDKIFETLSEGDFFGREPSSIESSHPLNHRTISNTDLCEIPSNIIADIPIVLWKLLEAYEKRNRLILNLDLSSYSSFEWKDWYSIGILEMDNQHKILFKCIADLLQGINEKQSHSDLIKKIDDLVEYTKFHFESEQQLLKKHEFPEYNNHKSLHTDLIHQICDLKTKLEKNNFQMELNLIEFFKVWIIDHIFGEDRKYSAFLKGGSQYFAIR